MANYANIIGEITAAIYTNDNEEITGAVLQAVLLDLVASLGSGYQYKGIATDETAHGTPDQRVFYIAPAGSYPNFGASSDSPYVVPEGCFGIFRYDSTWTKESIRISQPAPVTFATCDTPAATAAKVVTAANFELVKGAQMRVKFDYANSAVTPTLNVNGTGAIPVYYDGAEAGADNTWQDGETVIFYYDNTRWMGTNAENGSGTFSTGELVKETAITDEVEAGSDALPTSDAVAKKLVDVAGIDATVVSTIDNETIRDYIVGNRWLNNTGGIQTWNSTDLLLMPVTPGAIMAIRGLMIKPKTIPALWLYNGNPNGGGGTPVASVDTSYITPYEAVVFRAPEDATYVGIVINVRNIQDTDGNYVSFDSTETVYAEVYSELDLTVWGSRLLPVNKLMLLENRSGEASPLSNAKLAGYVLAKKGVNPSGAIVTWNNADLLVLPVEPGRLVFHNYQQDIDLNVWLYDGNPVAGGVLVQTIESYPFHSTANPTFEITDQVKFLVMYVAYRNVGGVSFDTTATLTADSYARLAKITDAFGKEVNDFVTLRATRDYTIENAEMVKYFVPGKTINPTTGALTNWAEATLLVFPVIPGEKVRFDGLTIVDLPPAGSAPNYGIYPSDPTRGTVYPTVMDYHHFVPGEPWEMTIPADIYYVAFLVAVTDYVYNNQHYSFDTSASIYAVVENAETRRTIWGTPAGTEIEKRLTNAGGGGGGAVSTAIDMGLPRDLPKVYIESELLTVVKDGGGHPTNEITPLTTAKNEVGDLDQEDVILRMESASGEYNFQDAIVIAYQGQSSLTAAKKNFSIDTKHKHRFGKWLEMDGFHLKGYNSDWLHIRDIMANRIYEQMLQTRTPDLRRPFCVENDFSAADVALLTESGVLCHIDGFPIELYINGDYWGIYSLNLKKHRSNYHLGKNDVKNIQIDPNWNTLTPSGWDWTEAEVRNPKSDSGNTEFIEGTVPNDGEVKTWWTNVLADLVTITAGTSEDTLRTFLNVESWVDIILLYDFIGDWDVFVRNTLYTTWNGNLLAALPYDHDGSFGIGRSQQGSQGYIGGDVEVPPTTNIFEGYVYQHCPWLANLETALRSLLRARYAELRMAGVFSQANVKSMCNAWTMLIGFDAYKKDLGRWTYEGYGAGLTNPGFYDSTNRIIDWIGTRVGYMDNKYGYNE